MDAQVAISFQVKLMEGSEEDPWMAFVEDENVYLRSLMQVHQPAHQTRTPEVPISILPGGNFCADFFLLSPM